MYELPDDIKEELEGRGFLTTRTVEFLTKAATAEAVCVEGVFVFQVGILPVIERDMKEFLTSEKEALVKQRRDFYRPRQMHVAGDLLIPVLENDHYYLMRIFSEHDMINVHIHNSLGMERRTTRFKIMVSKFFEWLSVLYPYHPLINKKEKGIDIQSKPSPTQTGVIDCGLFVIGFMMHILVAKSLFNLAFTQLDITKLRKMIPRLDGSNLSLGSIILAGVNIPSQFQTNPTTLPATCPPKKKQSGRAAKKARLEQVQPVRRSKRNAKNARLLNTKPSTSVDSSHAKLKESSGDQRSVNDPPSAIITGSIQDNTVSVMSTGSTQNDKSSDVVAAVSVQPTGSTVTGVVVEEGTIPAVAEVPKETKDESGNEDEEASSDDEEEPVYVPSDDASTESEETKIDLNDGTKAGSIEDGKDDNNAAPDEETQTTTEEKNPFLLDSFDKEYECMEVAKGAVYQYIKESGIQLRIKTSRPNLHCIFKCSQHVDCPFDVRINKVRLKKLWKIKGVNMNHTTENRKTADGRAIKHRKFSRDKSLQHVLRNKAEDPKAADVQHSAATNFSEALSYHQARRTVHEGKINAIHRDVMNFQRIVPYLDRLTILNPGSTIRYTIKDDDTLDKIFMSFPFMESMLNHVKSVVTLDACHIKHANGGTIYAWIVQAGNDETMPIGFGITAANESYETWSWMGRQLKKACPSLSSKHFVFVSDRDKGLDKSIKELYPYNVSTNCNFHIRQNVTKHFGASFGSKINDMGATFDVNEYEMIIELFKRNNPKKVDAFLTYLEGMPRFSWRSIDWVTNFESLIALPDEDWNMDDSNLADTFHEDVDGNFDSAGIPIASLPAASAPTASAPTASAPTASAASIPAASAAAPSTSVASAAASMAAESEAIARAALASSAAINAAAAAAVDEEDDFLRAFASINTNQSENNNRRQGMSYAHYIATGGSDKSIINDLPPRFGIITSNSSESFNKSIMHLRNKPWYDIVDGFVSQIIRKRSSRYELWKSANDRDVVENIKEKLLSYWNNIGGYEHSLLTEEGRRYCIFQRGSENVRGERHTLYVEKRFCTCGEWQEYLHPCIHLVVFLRQTHAFTSFEDMLNSDYIDDIYREKSIKEFYKNNIIAVASSLISCDGKTKAPGVTKKAGRPRKKRIRMKKKVTPTKTKKRKCSNCDELGHNIKTCPYPPRVD